MARRSYSAKIFHRGNPIGKVTFTGKSMKEAVGRAKSWASKLKIPFINPKGKQRWKNIEMGYHDSTGFHPIRASKDYSRSRAGEGKHPAAARARARRSTRKARPMH